MGSNALKGIILGLLLVVLAFVVGSQAASGGKQALMVVAGVVFVFSLLYLGRNCWWLVFIGPALLAAVPGALGPLSKMGSTFVVAAPVFVYWILLRVTGHVRWTWNGIAWLDAVAGLLFTYLAISFYRHPTSIRLLGAEESWGGEGYIVALGALLYYVFLSTVPMTLDGLGKILKISFFITLAACFLFLPLSLQGYGEVAEEGEESIGRFGGFLRIGSIIFTAVVVSSPPTAYLTSPLKLAGILLGALGVALSGFRSKLAFLCVDAVFMAFIWRQAAFALLGGAVAVSMVYVASEQELLFKLPSSIQRTLYALPGVKISKDTAANAQHSLDWRYEMWDWALDPRTGYIRDYVWGDGLGFSATMLRRQMVQVNRGRADAGTNEFYAERGIWHSGYITTIHRLGYVGLVLIFLFQLALLIATIRVCLAVRGRRYSFFFTYKLVGVVSSVIGFHISAGTIPNFLHSSAPMLLFAKLMYRMLIDEGEMEPMFTRHAYVPLAIREHEEQLAQGAES